MKPHPTHRMRYSDSSQYDFICDECMEPDPVHAENPKLAEPCAKFYDRFTVTDLEMEVLRAWTRTDMDFDVLPFNTIARRSGVPRPKIRRVVRAMARKGITEYHKGCWTEDGEPGGAGYGLTREGRRWMQVRFPDLDERIVE